MLPIKEDPSSGSLVQCLAKITFLQFYNSVVLSCPLTWTWSVLWHVHVNGHDRIILVILAKHCTRLPDDGSSVIRNMLEHF